MEDSSSPGKRKRPTYLPDHMNSDSDSDGTSNHKKRKKKARESSPKVNDNLEVHPINIQMCCRFPQKFGQQMSACYVAKLKAATAQM